MNNLILLEASSWHPGFMKEMQLVSALEDLLLGCEQKKEFPILVSDLSLHFSRDFSLILITSGIPHIFDHVYLWIHRYIKFYMAIPF